MTSTRLALPEVNRLANVERLSERYPTLAPQFHLIAVHVGELLVLGLHISTIGTAIDKVKVFVVALNARVVARGEVGAIDKIVRRIPSKTELIGYFCGLLAYF